MCGIFGQYARDGARLPDDILAAMGQTISHRGPDDRGFFNWPGVALGNQRLSVIDIEQGHQPFLSEDGAIALVQNGEIFNYRELAQELKARGNPCRSNSDTEVILRLFELDGIDCIKRLNGMFAIAIWDGRNQTLHLVRDRIGVKPLYVHDDGNKITFGSEIKALLPALKEVPAADWQAVHQFLSFNYVPAPLTMYEGVRHLMPGHRMEITAGNVRTERWWDLASQQLDHERSEESWIEEFNALLDDATQLRMRSDVPIGAFLSGGVDSSTIVGMMSRHSPHPVKSFCIGFEDPRFDESPFAQAAADRFSTDHTTEIVDLDLLELWPEATRLCDQPHGDVSFLPTYKVASLAARHVTVVLTGDGGDELFAGYDKHKTFFAQDDITSLSDADFAQRYFDSISLFTSSGKAAIYTEEMRARSRGLESSESVHPLLDRVSHWDRLNQALYLDMEMLLCGNNLVKPDRMGMAVSLEARTPFLDYRMMEFAFRIPGSLKLRGGETKYIYKKAVAPLIGHELAYRKKQMFTVPIGEWFKNRLTGWVRDNLGELVERCDYFDPAAIDNLLAEHVDGTANRTREIRALIALNHWFTLHEKQLG